MYLNVRYLYGAKNPCHEVCVEKCQVYGENGVKMGAGNKKWHVRRAGGDPAKPPKLGTVVVTKHDGVSRGLKPERCWVLFPRSLCGVLVFDSVSSPPPPPLPPCHSHTTMSQSIIHTHTQLCHTPSFAHNFVIHYLSHLFFVFSAFSVLLQQVLLPVGRIPETQ